MADEGDQPPEKFEELLGRLERIVLDMETAELPLDKLLSSYEEGMRLVKACGARLVDAEQKVEILSRAAASEAPRIPSGGAAAASSSEPSPAPAEEDIRLF